MFYAKRDVYSIISVYYDTKDFPKKYVARAYYTNRKTLRTRQDRKCAVFETYEGCKKAMQDLGLMRIDRQLDDHPHIIENWI